MLVIRGDERDVAASRDPGRNFDAGEQRHMDVEKCQVRCMRLDGVERGHAVARSRDDLQLRPQGVQQIGQLVGQ